MRRNSQEGTMSTEDNAPNAQELFASLWEQKNADDTVEQSSNEPQLESDSIDSESPEVESSPSLMDEYEKMLEEEGEGEEDDELAASEDSEESITSLPSTSSKKSKDSPKGDIEEILVKGAEGRKQKLKINYSDKKAIKQAFIKAAGMRKFQAERDSALSSYRTMKEDYDGLKNDFSKIDEAYEAHGAKGIVELLGGEEAWQKAVDDELANREYIAGLSSEQKYKMEMEKRDKLYQQQLQAERSQRETFQKQMEEKEFQTSLRELESKLHPAFDRYRFAGKLGDAATENLYDEAIWGKVKERLAEYPDDLELSQAIIDKEFRTVANAFKKHIKIQTEKQVKNTVAKRKSETAQRAQVAAKKGLKGSSAQRQMLQKLREGNLADALKLWKS